MSKISNQKYWMYPIKSKMDLIAEIGRCTHQLIHIVGAACKSIPFTDKAAKWQGLSYSSCCILLDQQQSSLQYLQEMNVVSEFNFSCI